MKFADAFIFIPYCYGMVTKIWKFPHKNYNNSPRITIQYNVGI